MKAAGTVRKLPKTYYVQGIMLGKMRITYSDGLELYLPLRNMTLVGETMYTSNKQKVKKKKKRVR